MQIYLKEEIVLSSIPGYMISTSIALILGGMNGSIVYELDRPENKGLKKSLKVSNFIAYTLFFCLSIISFLLTILGNSPQIFSF